MISKKLHASSVKIALAFFLFGVLWVSFSDRALLLFTNDIECLTKIQVQKDWLFVLATAVFIYFLTKRKINTKELEENKEWYGAFLRQTSEAIYRFDFKKPVDLSLPIDAQASAIISNGHLAEYNPSFDEMSCGGRQQELIGKNHYELFPDNAHVQVQELIKDLVQHNYTLKNHETTECDNNGQTRYFINNIVGIVSNNCLMRYWGTKLETTKLKKHERDLIKARKAAEQSDKLKSAFLANMSHEIRTPLNGILGFSELLCKLDLTESKRSKYIDIITACNNQLLRIINDILDVSRIETGQLSLEKSSFPLNILLDEIALALSHEIGIKNKSIKLIIEKNLPDGKDVITTDRGRLYQIITNLANNAIKFTKKGSVTIACKDQGNFTLEFIVSDTGIGVPNEYLGSIFDQFRQLEEFSKRKYGGTGLGLSISKGLVQVLGGYISVESEEGKGSTFKFTIKNR